MGGGGGGISIHGPLGYGPSTFSLRHSVCIYVLMHSFQVIHSQSFCRSEMQLRGLRAFAHGVMGRRIDPPW